MLTKLVGFLTMALIGVLVVFALEIPGLLFLQMTSTKPLQSIDFVAAPVITILSTFAVFGIRNLLEGLGQITQAVGSTTIEFIKSRKERK